MKKIIMVILCVSIFSCSTLGRVPSVDVLQYKEQALAETDKKLVEMLESWQSVKKANFIYNEKRTCNIYVPNANDIGVPKPVVIIANGYSIDEEAAIKDDDGALFKDFGPIASWGAAIAARGMVAVTYDSFDENPKRGEKVKPSESINRLAYFLKSNAKNWE